MHVRKNLSFFCNQSFYYLLFLLSMHRLLFLLFSFIFTCTSCIDSGDKHSKNKEEVFSEEQTLINQIKAYPDSFVLKEELIQFYRDNNDYEKAINLSKVYVKKDSLNARICHIQGYLYFENGDTVSAIESFNKAFQIFPDPQDLILEGKLRAMIKNIISLQIADSILKNQGPDFRKEAYFIKGLYQESIGMHQNAIEFFNKCLDQDFSMMDAYYEKAKAQILLKQTKDAIVTLQRAVTLNNNFSDGYLLLAQCHEKTGNKKQAAEAYRRCLLHEPDNEQAIEGLNRVTE